MSDFFHFNPFPEAPICMPKYDPEDRLKVFIPLLTNSTKGDVTILKKIKDGILDLKYYLKYKPAVYTPRSSFKFMCTLIKEDFSDIKFIRHKVYFIDSNAELPDNLSNYPFEKPYIQTRILSIDPEPSGSFSLLNLDKNKSHFELVKFIEETSDDTEYIRNKTLAAVDEISGDKLIKVIDSCTIPPNGV